MSTTGKRIAAAAALSAAILGGTLAAADAHDTRSDCTALVAQADQLVLIHAEQRAALYYWNGLQDQPGMAAERHAAREQWAGLTADYTTAVETYKTLRADCR